MKHLKKRIFTSLLAMAMCLSMSLPVCAAEPTENDAIFYGTFTITAGDEGIMPLGTIGGYGQATITHSNNTIYISCDSEGSETGSGMGITIKTTCSKDNGAIVGFDGEKYSGGDASKITGYMGLNSEVKRSNLYQNNTTGYRISFTLPQNCPSFTVQVWIYG